MVITADGPSAAQVDTFSLRTASGDVLQFSVGRLDLSNGGLPAPHLREHLVSGDPIEVGYLVDGSALIAVRFVDAP